MSDATLILQENGGDLVLSSGTQADVVVGNGLESAFTLSLWGGNMDDDGLPGADGRQFWGNLIAPDPAEKMRSETQRLLETIPATSANLLRVQDAAERDLAWLLDDIAQALIVDVALVGVRRIQITADITIAEREYRLQDTREWKGGGG